MSVSESQPVSVGNLREVLGGGVVFETIVMNGGSVYSGGSQLCSVDDEVRAFFVTASGSTGEDLRTVLFPAVDGASFSWSATTGTIVLTLFTQVYPSRGTFWCLRNTGSSTPTLNRVSVIKGAPAYVASA